MNRIQSVVKMHMRNPLSWFMMPWVIIAVSFAINFIISSSLNDGEDIHTGSIASIFVYTFVAGTLTLKDTFSFALGFSVRRKDYWLGTVLMAVSTYVLSGLLLTALTFIEDGTHGWGVRLHFFKVEFLGDLSFPSMLGINVILLLHFYFLGLAISSLHRRTGAIGMYGFFTALLLLGSIGTYVMTHYQLWMDFGLWVAHHYMSFFWWMIPLALIYSVISYGLLRRAAA
ncbi:hypothetical protein [Paenibacillus whitsoniae]|uniref:Uncharacterized protein n=1 Tax=Paenibacillus whitsoniae TaxID=2496558 RepID=A0A3S0AL04_9BACL|nr:hypothetical protein [Paenibacillus whitsoniae]RTE04363.1 hypothetical protein EJQ19_26600 [Paenibacillus whitsoniae]